MGLAYSGWAFSGLVMDRVTPKANVPKICHKYPTMMRLGTSIPFLKESLMHHVTHRLISADIINF